MVLHISNHKYTFLTEIVAVYIEVTYQTGHPAPPVDFWSEMVHSLTEYFSGPRLTFWVKPEHFRPFGRWRSTEPEKLKYASLGTFFFKHTRLQKQYPETNLHADFVRHPWEMKPTALQENRQKPASVFSEAEAKPVLSEWKRFISGGHAKWHTMRRYGANGQFAFQMDSTLSVIHQGPAKAPSLRLFSGPYQMVVIFFFFQQL